MRKQKQNFLVLVNEGNSSDKRISHHHFFHPLYHREYYRLEQYHRQECSRRLIRPKGINCYHQDNSFKPTLHRDRYPQRQSPSVTL